MKKSLLLCILIAFVACSGYGEKVVYNATDVYYKDGVTKEQADKLGKYLVLSGIADGNRKSVQLIVDDITKLLTFKMVVDETVLDDPEYDYIFKAFLKELSNEFDQSVDFHLCDNRLKTLKVLD